MTIRPKWLKDIFSLVFTGYYLVFAREGDEVVRLVPLIIGMIPS